MRALICGIGLTLIVATTGVSDERFPVMSSDVVKKACSDCHMVYQSQMLPRASWQTIMDRLSDHFGEDASLAEPVRKEVQAYYLAHAADVERSKVSQEFLRGVDRKNPPLRITETPHFIREHRKIAATTWKDPKVGSKANCAACHPSAIRGDYEQARLP